MAKFKTRIFEKVLMTGIADKGKAIGRHEGAVVFVEGAVPGDICDVMVFDKKKGSFQGKVQQMIEPSPDRVIPFCEHFGVCGGCKWQHLSYEAQLRHKQMEVENALLRIGKVEVAEYLPIEGAKETNHYRNKLEFTFSNKKWLTKEQIDSADDISRDACGFHLPGYFDKILDIEECHLQKEPSNAIRNGLRDFALEKGLSFYDIRNHSGFMRILMLRITETGEIMALMCFGEDQPENIKLVLEYLESTFPAITTIVWAINTKVNDAVYDLDIKTYKGPGYVKEKLKDIEYIISPKSFFQTNTRQGEVLYQTALDFAGLTGEETVYDLYTGTGSIACFVSKHCKTVVGVEEIEMAIDDAKRNAAMNGLTNTDFYVGDVKDVLSEDFAKKHGKADVVITDPPRAGMHPKVVDTLLEWAPPRIVYVSCNPSTQARDLALLSPKYKVLKSKAVDMFPHTQHIENVVLMELI